MPNANENFSLHNIIIHKFVFELVNKVMRNMNEYGYKWYEIIRIQTRNYLHIKKYICRMQRERNKLKNNNNKTW